MALYQSIIALIYLVSLTTTVQPPAPGTPNSFPQKSALAKKDLFTPKETKSSSIENEVSQGFFELKVLHVDVRCKGCLRSVFV